MNTFGLRIENDIHDRTFTGHMSILMVLLILVHFLLTMSNVMHKSNPFDGRLPLLEIQ